MGYTKDVVKGISWLGLFRVSSRGVSLVRTIILARLLSPSQFGFFSIATIVLTFIELITETGINIILLQKKDSIEKYLNTAWVVSIARGILISIAIVLLAYPISLFFNTQDALPLLLLISIVPLLRGFINPSIVVFVKDLKFSKEFVYRLSIFVVESVVTLVYAYFSPTAYSLVVGLIAGAAFEVILSFLMAKPYPQFIFEKPIFKEILSSGKWLTVTGVLNYLYHNGDDIIVGKFLGPASLGLYDLLYRVSMLPISEGSDVIGKATFPVYVKVNDDKKRLKRAYLRSLGLITCIAIPIGALLILFPKQVIEIVLGPKWLGGVEVLQLLAVFGVLRAISISAVGPLYALQKQKMVTVITLVSFVGLAVTIIPFVQRWGLLGACYSAILGTVLSIPVIIYYLRSIFTEASE